ncbi:MAG: molecular chaperone TorD family protein [Burkholderiales bacterium]|nr:molecular chaperone TorD family protein [Burkholderiales bacterium]
MRARARSPHSPSGTAARARSAAARRGRVGYRCGWRSSHAGGDREARRGRARPDVSRLGGAGEGPRRSLRVSRGRPCAAHGAADRATGAERGRAAVACARARACRARAWAGTDDEHARDEYARLFLGSARAPMRETAYGDGRRLAGRSAELADIAGFYAAFGFAMSDEDRQPPDHLCAELEFCSLLLVKCAYALRDGWTERGRVAEAALRRFLEDHLGRWTHAFCDLVGLAAARAPYRESAALPSRRSPRRCVGCGSRRRRCGTCAARLHAGRRLRMPAGGRRAGGRLNTARGTDAK